MYVYIYIYIKRERERETFYLFEGVCVSLRAALKGFLGRFWFQMIRMIRIVRIVHRAHRACCRGSGVYFFEKSIHFARSNTIEINFF